MQLCPVTTIFILPPKAKVELTSKEYKSFSSPLQPLERCQLSRLGCNSEIK